MQSPKLLVVDDNPTDLELVVAALSEAHCTPRVEVDSGRALKRFEDEGPWDLVISDLKMPGIDGLTLLRRIRAHDPLTETIIITGHADIRSAIEALALGAFRYLIKPVHPRELRHCVAQALERRRLTEEQRRLIGELEEREARRARQIAAIASTGDALSSMERPTESRDAMLHEIATTLGAEGVVVFLFDETRNEMVLAAHRGLPQAVLDEVIRRGLPVAECTMGCSAHSGEPVRVRQDASLDPRPCARLFRVVGVTPLLSAPLRSQQQFVGCLVTLSQSGAVRTFNSEDSQFLEAISHLIGNAIQARRREQQTRDAEKLAAVGELASGVAHELGNALAVVGGAVQYLLANTDTASPSRPYLDVIQRNVAAGDRIIKDLLSFARPRRPCQRVIEIEPILEQACLSLKGEVDKRGIEICRHYWPGSLQVLADAEQLHEVFLNILLNAIQAMPKGGTVTLRTVPEAPGPPWAGVRVEIADTGGGIPPEYLHRVFDPFFTTKEGGTGLGLSVSRRIVAAHGGDLGVNSQEGRGTRFTIRLPVSPQPYPHSGGEGGPDSAAAHNYRSAA